MLLSLFNTLRARWQMADNSADMDSPAVQPVLGRRTRVIEDIQRLTGKRVKIEAQETDDTLTRCHPQDQCVLFNTLPRELRDLIWAFAIAPYEDQNNKYEENEYYHRPGHTARLKTDFTILLTCRRIWLEASAMPMLQAEHCFWFYRAAPDARSHHWMSQLTSQNRGNFGELHMFVQMYAIERLSSHRGRLRNFFLRTTMTPGDFQPRIFHVTIRHTDWWNWEHEEPLRFEDRWFQAMLDSPDLRSTHILKLELETLDYKVPQMEVIVDRLSALQSSEYPTHFVSGKHTPTKFVFDGKPEVQTWSGPSNINGQTFEPYKHRDTLNYHIVTLTWKLHFPEHRHAHVPTMRLAPRVVGDAIEDAYASDEDSGTPSEDNRPDALGWYSCRRWGDHHHPHADWLQRWQIFGREPEFFEYHPTFWRFDMDGQLEEGNMSGRMMNEQIHLEAFQKYYADNQEVVRHAAFDTLMASERARLIKSRWQREGALLRFRVPFRNQD